MPTLSRLTRDEVLRGAGRAPYRLPEKIGGQDAFRKGSPQGLKPHIGFIMFRFVHSSRNPAARAAGRSFGPFPGNG